MTNEDDARSPCKVSDHVRVMKHCDGSGAIMTIVRANRRKAVLRSIREIFIFDTYIHSSALPLGQ